NYEYAESCPWEIRNTFRPGPYSVIPFLLPPPKNPCATRAQKAPQAGRRRFDPVARSREFEELARCIAAIVPGSCVSTSQARVAGRHGRPSCEPVDQRA